MAYDKGVRFHLFDCEYCKHACDTCKEDMELFDKLKHTAGKSRADAEVAFKKMSKELSKGGGLGGGYAHI